MHIQLEADNLIHKKMATSTWNNTFILDCVFVVFDKIKTLADSASYLHSIIEK